MEFKSIETGNVSLKEFREQNLAFADKTRYIKELEEHAGTKCPLFLRPRRFGKSLICDMLFYYYDKSLAESFDENFKGTWIYDHRTKQAYSFYCLRFDFSAVGFMVTDLLRQFTGAVISGLTDFTLRYPDLGLPPEKLKTSLYKTPGEALNAFLNNFNFMAGLDAQICLIIEDYDHFIYSLFSEDHQAFCDLAANTYNLQNIRQFYTSVKSRSGAPECGAPISRIFLSGISRVSLDSLLSGFNIETDISAKARFNAMAGFTHDELSKIIDETMDFSLLGGITKDQVMEALERRCGGYRFSERADEEIFCPGAALAFLHELKSAGKIPWGLKDLCSDIKTRKLNDILRVTEPAAAEEISDAIFRRKSIASGEPVSFSLDSRHMKTFGRSQALSQLLYRGYLTREPERPDSNGLDVWYRAPNEACYLTFVEYEAERVGFSRARGLDLSAVSERGELMPLLNEVSARIARLDPSALPVFNERSLQTVFFCTAMDGNDNALQPELQCGTGDGGRADLFIRNRTEGGRQYLLALKYLSGAAGTGAAVTAKLEEAMAQLAAWRNAPNFKDVHNLDCRAIVFVNAEPKAVEKLP